MRYFANLIVYIMILVKDMDGGDGLEDDIFIKIYNEYLSYVYRYLYGLTYNHQTSEDLTQETFVKALCVLQFPNESIKSWLLTVAHNLYVDYVRKNRRLDFGQDNLLNQIKIQDFTDGLILKESTMSALLLIKELPEKQRQAVLLCLVNELSYQQAGEILGISISAVTNLIYRARKTLRTLRRNINE
ncbi:MAG: RNA polymerase subunit sigma-24 [Firmicutes bacterium HGW-Firmicutes-7]|nr:MAG: RNA polymerase subunit sigma-24 [Firmicutes bacterium HGW-Firmicutes-7]